MKPNGYWRIINMDIPLTHPLGADDSFPPPPGSEGFPPPPPALGSTQERDGRYAPGQGKYTGYTQEPYNSRTGMIHRVVWGKYLGSVSIHWWIMTIMRSLYNYILMCIFGIYFTNILYQSISFVATIIKNVNLKDDILWPIMTSTQFLNNLVWYTNDIVCHIADWII